MKTFADDELSVRDVDAAHDRGTLGALHAMIRPQHLCAIRELDRFEGLLARML